VTGRRIRVKLVVLLLGVGVLTACSGTAATPLGDLTYDEYTTAVATAREEASGQEGATITGATARVHRGTVLVQASNTGHGCESGRLLEITVAGTFPDIVILPGVGAEPEDMVVTALLLTADAETGEVCLQGVHTGPVVAGPRDVVLDLDDRPLGEQPAR
jgi:hypothetical protein